MKIAPRPWILLSLALSLALACPRLAPAAVRAWQGTVTIPTYAWQEDPYPKFQALGESPPFSTTVGTTITYPYTMQDHLLRTKADRRYKALFLENEYLKITCLPELGGRLHSVLDKTEGKEMFHLNHVIKPGMIALRGAFISGGVEWNAGPHGHTVTIVSPVDALLGENPDGSAWLEVSNQEMICRTRWTVRVTLHPGRSCLDEQIRISNPTDGLAPYYFWNCTAFPNRPGTRFIYPMRLGTDHFGREFFPWPVHEGKDLSWLKNWEIYASVFAVGCDQDFFGAYDVDADRGIVATANHYELCGKKAWTWGNWDFGRVAQQALTDDDGPYIEVQSGPLPTQLDYGLLAPRDQIAWQEWWYPVHGLGQGFQYANKDVAVEAAPKEGTLRLRILATGEFPEASCTLSGGDGDIVRWTAPVAKCDLSPARPAEIAVRTGGAGPIQVVLRANNGTLLARFSIPLKLANPTPPQRAGKPDAELSAEELYLKAERAYRAIHRRPARQYCEKALAKDPGFTPALRLLGVLDLAAGLYPRARERLGKALARQSDDGLAWYFLGIGNLRDEGHDAEALACGYRAARCSGTASIGYDLAGRAHLRRKEPALAVAAFRKAVAANPRDGRAKDHLALALYAVAKAGGTQPSPLPPGEGQGEGGLTEAQQIARQRVAEDPTDLLPRAILAMRDAAGLKQFVKDAQAFVGEYEFNMLETSLALAEVGMTDEAGRLLYAACIETTAPPLRAATESLPEYYLAYFARFTAKNQEGLAAWQRAGLDPEKGDRPHLPERPGGGYPLGVAQMGPVPFFPHALFPSRPEELAVLKYLLAARTKTASVHFALGNLLAHYDRMDEAIQQWKEAARVAPNFAEAWRNLGLAAWKGQADLDAAQAHYRRAISLHPQDQTLYRDLGEILMAAGRRAEAIQVLRDMPVRQDRRSEITILLARAYLDEQRYDGAIRLLESTPYFVNWEGQQITWTFFNQAHVRRGEQRLRDKQFQAALADFEAAVTYPANLNVGRSNRPPESRAMYGKGRALAGLGRAEAARAAWQQGAALPESLPPPEGDPDQNRYRQLCKEALTSVP